MKALWLNEALTIKPETAEERAVLESLQTALAQAENGLQLVEIDHEVPTGPSGGLVNE